MIVLLSIVYPSIIWGIAQIFPNSGKGNILEYQGKKYYEHIGQNFSSDRYFWSRPSAVDYNAAGSGGSNKGPSNEEYLKDVEKRIDHLLKNHPGLKKSDIPVDMITASGSELDPHISVQAARIQMNRIAENRKLSAEQVDQLINNQIEAPFLGLFGPEKINVLKLNLALDQLSK